MEDSVRFQIWNSNGCMVNKKTSYQAPPIPTTVRAGLSRSAHFTFFRRRRLFLFPSTIKIQPSSLDIPFALIHDRHSPHSLIIPFIHVHRRFYFPL